MCSSSSPAPAATLGDILAAAVSGSTIAPGVISAEAFADRAYNSGLADIIAMVIERDRLLVSYGRNSRTKVATPDGVRKLVERIGDGMSQAEAIELISSFIEQESIRIHAQVEAEMKRNLDMISRDKVKEAMQAIADHMHGDRKIEAIKEVRSISGFYLKEAKDWVQSMYQTYNKYDSNPAAAPASVKESKVTPTYLILTKTENQYGREAWSIAGRFGERSGSDTSARRQAEAIVSDLIRAESDEVKLVQVIGETKPVFQLVA